MSKIQIRFVENTPSKNIGLICQLFESNGLRPVIDNKNYDYLFATEHIYMTSNRHGMRDLLDKMDSKITIMFMGEAISPDFNLFDYAICFDQIPCNDRALKIPNAIFFKKSLFTDIDTFKNHVDYSKLILEKTKFCNYIYSNKSGHKNRETFFRELSKYRFVDSLGKHMNNSSPSTRARKSFNDWREESIALKSDYKFSIAFENAMFQGYTTEKILTSVQAHTVPIYWGNPNVGIDYNTNSFINCHDYDSFDQVIEHIKIIDENDDLWCQIMREPFRTAAQIRRASDDALSFDDKFKNIFEQGLTKARRRPEGCWVDSYKSFLRSNSTRGIWNMFRALL